MATVTVDEDFPDLSYEADLCGNIEQALKALQGYGIMVLELIQNADDAKARTLRIDAQDDALVVENDEVFTRCSLAKKDCDWAHGDDPTSDGRRSCNFHAITRMGGRSKLGSEDQIGRFGIGFVSVYQVTDTPIIRSAGVEYTLNPKDGRARRKAIDDISGTQFVLPWAFEDSEVRNAIHQNVVSSDIAEKVVAAVSDTLPTSVLFLRHLERIEVCRSGKLKASVDIKRTGDGLDLLFEPQNTVQRWIVQSRDAEDVVSAQRLRDRFPGLNDLKRSTTVSVALPVDLEVNEGLIYAFLPTKKTTGLPLHINADFFPHASRQEIVLGSDSQECFWNQAMLAAAAQIIGERFELFKSILGYQRLWKLGDAAQILASKDPAFACFWSVFSASAKACESVWTVDGCWDRPEIVRSAPLTMTEAEQAGVASFGLKMLHPSLREHLNALSATGVGMLKITDIAVALSAAGTSAIRPENPNLRLLWSALDGMLQPPRVGLSRPHTNSAAPLIDVPFLLDRSGAPVSPKGAWRLPDNVPSDLIGAVLPDLGVIHSDVLRHSNLARQIGLLDLDSFARILAKTITDEEEAISFFGPGDKRLRNAYRLFTLLWQEQLPTNSRNILWDVPFLRKADGRFTTPARGLLPGEFRDPTGWFDFVDVAPFPPGMKRFAAEVLAVDVMPFAEFVGDHLGDTIERGLTLEQYRTLLAEIADHRHQLEDVLETIRNVAFVRNRAGEFVCPRDCYFWDAAIESVLGRDPARWVDYAWLPSDQDKQTKLRDFFEAKLGMPDRVSAEHVVERIQAISEDDSPAVAKKELSPIFRHLIDAWPRLDVAYREELGTLSEIAFLPALFDGEPDESKLHRPDEVFRAGRAPGFSSQVPVIDLPPLRENRRAVNELLGLLDVQEEPETSVVVDHLLACMEAGRDPHALTYQILGERCDESDSIDEIDRLVGLPCIYFPGLGYVRPSQVFWSDPPIHRYWHKAHAKMMERQSLFSQLGVCMAPESMHYAELALEVASGLVSEVEISIHARCVRYLADALWTGSEADAEAVDKLADEESLLTISGRPIWPGDALWMDSEQHLAPFGGDLDDIVVAPPPDCDIAALRKLYSRLGAAALSNGVRLELARDPNAVVDQHATDLLRERASLLLRLAPNKDSRAELSRLLSGVTVRLAPGLLTKAELVRNGVTHGSEAVEADAFVDRTEPAIFLAGAQVKWVLLAKHMFDAIAPLCPTHDMRSLAGTAMNVLQAPSLEDAHEIMDELHYSEHVAEDETAYQEEQAPDIESWWEDGEEPQTEEQPSTEVVDGNPQLEPSPGETRNEEAAGEPTPNGEGLENGANARNDDPYKSRVTSGGIGNDADGAAPSDAEKLTARPNGRENPDPLSITTRNSNSRTRAERAERRNKRRDRLLSYVASDDYESTARNEDEEEGERGDLTDEIGMAAVTAVLSYEKYHGRAPEEMPHFNPGYDVVSLDDSGPRRLIEVKGIDGEWNEVGVKLSRRQFRFAQEHPDEFWLYVVEHALDPDKSFVRPLRNPFARVDGYLFDHEWRKACEASTSAKTLLVRVGASVEDWRWGKGSIIELMGRGLSQQAKVRFPIHGVKAIPVSKLNIVD